jgi:hypothetical protein
MAHAAIERHTSAAQQARQQSTALQALFSANAQAID